MDRINSRLGEKLHATKLMDVSKAFVTIYQAISIAKLENFFVLPLFSLLEGSVLSVVTPL